MSKGLNTGQFKYDELPSTYRNPDDMGWWNWNKTAATRDAKLIEAILILRTMQINKLLKFKDFSEDLKCLHQLQL